MNTILIVLLIISIVLLIISIIYNFILNRNNSNIIFKIQEENRVNREILISEHSYILKKAREQSVASSKAITRGKITEEFIPLFPDFPYNLSDCKFSGQPLDFLIFKGMTDIRDEIKNTEIEIIFADVKVNKSSRTPIQNAIKSAIENKRVKFETWNITEDKKIIIK